MQDSADRLDRALGGKIHVAARHARDREVDIAPGERHRGGCRCLEEAKLDIEAFLLEMPVLMGDEAAAVGGEAQGAHRELVGGGRGFRESHRGEQRRRGQLYGGECVYEFPSDSFSQ